MTWFINLGMQVADGRRWQHDPALDLALLERLWQQHDVEAVWRLVPERNADRSAKSSSPSRVIKVSARSAVRALVPGAHLLDSLFRSQSLWVNLVDSRAPLAGPLKLQLLPILIAAANGRQATGPDSPAFKHEHSGHREIGVPIN